MQSILRASRGIALSEEAASLRLRKFASTQSRVRPKDRFSDYTRDEQITSQLVRVKDDNGSVGQTQYLDRVLRNIDRQTQTLVQLAKDDGSSHAIVQVYALTDLLKKVRDKEDRAKEVAKAARERKPKQIELNWAIGENDLGLKLKQLETFLSKGKKVEILFAARKGQRRASSDEGEDVLAKVRERVDEMGAREIKPMEGQILKQVTLVVQKS